MSESYESELRKLGLTESVLAYRQVPIDASGGGKCNIHFAKDAFLRIRKLSDCSVIVLDVSSYFESLDHGLLKDVWARLIGFDRLPKDHFQVFRAITQYSWVDKKELYERLGHFGVKMSSDGKAVPGYLTSYKKVPKRLCNGRDFRSLIAGGNGVKSIINRNYKPYGIPQGAPISDVLANMYLLDFDSTVVGWVRGCGGSYYRYSDDILLVLPRPPEEAVELLREIQGLIRRFGDKLTFKDEKTSIIQFHRDGPGRTSELIQGAKGRNGLEYLGFRFDGKRVYLRDSTLSSLQRKITGVSRHAADAWARRFPDRDLNQLKATFDYERLVKRFGRVENFGEKHGDYRSWTFWTYAVRAREIFGSGGSAIIHQLRNHREWVRVRLNKALEAAFVRRERRRNSSRESQRDLRGPG